MTFPTRPLVLGLLAVGFSALIFSRAQAGGGHYYPPVTDPVPTPPPEKLKPDERSSEQSVQPDSETLFY